MADDEVSSGSFGNLETPGRTTGVVVGIVVDNKDPQGEGRVKIKLPGLTDAETALWARVATLMAGPQRGALFLPEVGDEVLAAFEWGDMMRPYILGCLWNGKDKPPDANADGKNNLRMLKSRSGHIIRLDDTNGSEKIEIIDKTGKNSLTFDAAQNTITLKSDKDIVLNAARGMIKLTAQSIEISTTEAAKVEAKGGLTLEGTPGNTVIKGATVEIN